MPHVALRFALLFMVFFAAATFLIRAQPYQDRARSALNPENCTTPCFMGIRPGFTSMRGAISIIESHDWVAPGAGFPALVRNAVFFDAGVPRTRVEWRWNDILLPAWINRTERGQLTLEDREVRDLTIDTNLAFGEIVLAFGNPNQTQFTSSNSILGRRFDYSAWYAESGVLIAFEGSCTLWNYYHASVRIVFRPNPPQLSEPDSRRALCSESSGK